jgi:MscS family membrane protein
MFEQYFPNEYLRAFVVLAGSMILLRCALTLAFLTLKFLTRKTKTKADDLLIAKSRNPITLWFFLISIRLGIEEVTLVENLASIIENTISSLIVISLAYVLYLILDIIIFSAIKKMAKRTKTEIDDGLFSIVQSALKIALIVLAFLYVLSLWGVEIGPFLAGLGIAGLAVALALQPTLSNIFSGAALILDKTVRIGDLVYLDAETRGIIEKIGFRSTKIKTADNELIIIPNSKLADSKIQNIALPEPKSRVIIPFSVGYGSDIQKVKKVVLKAIMSVEKASKDPAPTVQFIGMGASSLDFKAFFFVNHYSDRGEAIDDANTKVYGALNKNKINIPFPQLDVRVKKK